MSAIDSKHGQCLRFFSVMSSVGLVVNVFTELHLLVKLVQVKSKPADFTLSSTFDDSKTSGML